MAETVAAENGVVDGDQADDCDVNEANDAVHSAQQNRDELDSEQAANHSTSSQQPKALTASTDCQEINSGGLQQAPAQCVVSHIHTVTAG